jgi:hypothetical protein
MTTGPPPGQSIGHHGDARSPGEPDRAVRVNAGISADRLPPVAAAGVLLAKIVLAMVMVSILLLAAYLIIVDANDGAALAQAYGDVIRQASPGTPATADQLRTLGELAKQMGEQRQAFRAFWLQVAQLVLLNLLLPLMTALLGYIFGTTHVAQGGRGDDV